MTGGAFGYAVAGAWILCIGLYFLLTQADMLRRVLAANVMSTGIFLVLVSMARRMPDGPPDPVPHAMVLTGIVVAVSTSVLLLALICREAELAKNEPAVNREDIEEGSS